MQSSKVMSFLFTTNLPLASSLMWNDWTLTLCPCCELETGLPVNIVISDHNKVYMQKFVLYIEDGLTVTIRASD